MENKELAVIISQSGLEHTKAQFYGKVFSPFMQKVNEFETQLSSINSENPTAEDSQRARELRLSYARNRGDADKERVKLKQSLLNETGLIQSLFNVIEKTSKIKEEHLDKIEKYQALIEQKRKDDLLRKRQEELSQYVMPDAIGFYNLADMPEEHYQRVLAECKHSHEVKIEAEEKAKADQIAKEKAEAEENERIRVENEKLKKEQEAIIKKHAEEQAQAKKDREVLEAKLKKEQEDKAKAEQEQKRLADIEAKKKSDELEAQRLALLAPDKEKVKAWVDQILAIEKPALKDVALANKLQIAVNDIKSILQTLQK